MIKKYLSIGLLLLFLYLSLKNGMKRNSIPTETGKIANKKNFTEADFVTAVKKCKSLKIPYEKMKIIEKMYRNETGNFTSNQYKRTGTGGMETKDGKNIPFPYGWGSLVKFKDSTGIQPSGIALFTDNQTKKQRYFVIFDSVFHAVAFKMFFIEKYRNGEWWKWNSLKPEIYENYKKLILPIKTPITNKIYGFTN